MTPLECEQRLRELLAAGRELGDALAALRGAGASTIQTMAAVRAVQGVSITEAKSIVLHSPAWTEDLEAHDRFVDDLIEQIEERPDWPLTLDLDDNTVDQIKAALYSGQRIAALKLHRKATGLGIVESHEFIQELDRQLRAAEPDKFTAPPQTPGCFSAFLVVALAVVLIYSL